MYVLDVVDEEVEEPHACSCTDSGSQGEEELTLVSASPARPLEGETMEGIGWRCMDRIQGGAKM